MILVTGGAGYIGSHVVKELLKKKYKPVVFDNLSLGNRELLVPQLISEEHLILGDLLDVQSLEKVFQNFTISAVIHFAALASVPESIQKPLLYYENNVVGTLNLLQAMKRHQVNKFIFSSTAAVYGHAQTTPITETHPCCPINPYGQSKRMVEQILADLGQLQSISLRYFNAAGADPEGKIGERHREEDHLIPRILKEVFQAKKEGRTPKAIIYGKNYPTTDGTCIRDFIHVCDLAAAHLLALENLEKNNKSKIYNLGTSNGYSVKEIIEVASKVTGVEIQMDFQNPRPGDPPTLIASPALIQKEMGWNPKFSNINDLIETAWRWEQKEGTNPHSS